MERGELTTRATLLGEPLPVELMNTVGIDRGGVHDALADDAEAAAWLRAVGTRLVAEAGGTLDPAAFDAAELHPHAGRLRDLRDALRRLAAQTTGDPRPPATRVIPVWQDAIDMLNAAARGGPQLVWPADGEPARAFRADGSAGELAVSLIAHQAVELFTGPARGRLRACLAPACMLFFLKEHARRQWCSAACGNRARVARHYRRHHTDGGPPARARRP